MSYKQILDDIKNNEIKSLYLIYGEETFLIDKSVESIVNAVVTNYPEMNYTHLEEEYVKADLISTACETFPFGCEKRLVVVRDIHLLKGATKADDSTDENTTSKDVSNYIEILDNLGDTVCLAFVVYGTIDKRKKLFGEIKKRGSIIELNRIEREDLSKWIKTFLNKDKKKINPKELDYFIHVSSYTDKNTDVTLYDIENLLKKLVSFSSDEQYIEIKHIDAIMPRNIEHDIFKLINACSEKKISDSLRIYGDLLSEGEQSMGILAMVSKQIKNIISASELSKKGMDARTASQYLKIHEYTVKLCMKYSSVISSSKLLSAFNKCLEAEYNVKSGKMTERLAMELLFVGLFE